MFYRLFTAIIIAALCEWGGNVLQGAGADKRVIHIMVKAVELSVAPSIGIFVGWVMKEQRDKRVYAFLAFHAILEFLSGVFGFIYYVDSSSFYIHGPFYWIYVLAYIMASGYGIVNIYRNLKRYQYDGSEYVLTIVLFMITGITIQMCDSRLKVDYIVTGLASVMIYVLTLEMIYHTDELTELVNRRGFENAISRVQEVCIIVFLDVDSFKSINDNYGHAYGDHALKIVAKVIREHYAGSGICFRYGGDEFCVLMHRNLDQIETINEAIRRDLNILRETDPHLPGVSIGYAYYDWNYQNIRDVIEEADQMMYRKKERRKNVIVSDDRI